MAMKARDREAALLTRCGDVARGKVAAEGPRVANVFHVAAGVVGGAHSRAAERLQLVSRRYLNRHPGERVSTAEVVERGWVAALPRLRDMLTRQLAV